MSDSAPHLPKALRRQALLRVGGLPTRVVESQRDPELLAAWHRLRAASAARAAAATAASDALFALVGAVDDRPTRNRLLALRRALFNGREPAAGDLAALAAVAPDPVSRSVASVREAAAAEREARDALASRWRAALAAARARMLDAIGDADFEKGVLLSSRTLYDNLATYRAGIATRSNSRLEQIERGILRYLTRTAMKATPFGRLCAVAGARFAGNGASAIELASASSRKVAAVRLNKVLQSLLWTAVKTAPMLRRHVPVELNPTVDEGAAEFVVLTGVGAVEAFRRIKRNEAIDVVVGAARGAGTLPLRHLAEALQHSPEVEATADEAFAYLESLLGAGLLRFNSGIPGQSAEWEAPLRNLIAGVEDATATTVVEIIDRLVAARDAYEGGSATERLATGGQLGDVLEDVAQRFKTGVTTVRNLPLYEDAALSGEATLRTSAADAHTLATLERYFRATLAVAWPRAEQVTMRHVFERLYPEPGIRVPLLRFYEDYFREHYKGHSEKEALRRRNPADPQLQGYNVDNPFNLPEVQQIGAASVRLVNLLRAAWRAAPDAEEVSVTLYAVVAALAVPGLPLRAGRSISVFTVPVRRGDDRFAQIFVPNGAYAAGYGKFFSRFLHVLPERYREGIRAANRTVHAGRLAEIAADGFFNANLHPPLTDDEISYPTGDGATTHEQLALRDLLVGRCDEDPHALAIVHRATGETIHPLDLGFQNPRMRPPLYQLLARMAPVGLFGLQMPETPYVPAASGAGGGPPGAAAPAPSVKYRPRMAIDHRIVLSRRTWTVPNEIFPTPVASEDDAAYFERLTAWRTAHAIPDEVYARVFARPAPGAPPAAAETPRPVGDDEHDDDAAADPGPLADAPSAAADGAAAGATKPRPAAPRSSRDFVKPQYIDFVNPLLVRLFAKLPSPLTHFFVVLEERYPPGDRLPVIEDDRYTSELLLEFAWTASELAGSGA